ncbi:outer membrane receptor for ferric coprogen and ferric-rhodotorulic acid [Acidovorax sp. MR-S7]|nr:outer membrane receptor for ferric coprogen and ferric-rhodotorulic acid [Acidovorax sp. MR-S7]
MLTDRPARAGGGLSVYTKFCTPSSTDYRLPGAWSRLRIGGALSWQSRMETTKTFGGVTATRVQGAYALLNLSAHYDLTRQTRLSLHIDNVLDKHYYAGFGGYGGGYWGAPRNFLMTLRHQF